MSKRRNRTRIIMLLLFSLLFSSLTPDLVLAVMADSSQGGSSLQPANEPAPSSPPQPVKQLVGLATTGASVTGSVYEAVYTPLLDPLPAFTNANPLIIHGEAAAGSTVTVSYSYNGGAPVTAGQTVAAAGEDGVGRFTVDVPTGNAGEGQYVVTAAAQLGGITSPASSPQIVNVDFTAPRPVAYVDWELTDSRTLHLTWEESYVPDPVTGIWGPDPDAGSYRIYDGNHQLLAETADKEYSFGNLSEYRTYSYYVTAVDHAGNESIGADATAGTPSRNTTKLSDLVSDGGYGRFLLALSGDGSTAAYSQGATEAGNSDLYITDTATGATTTLDLSGGDGPWSFGSLIGLDLSWDGNKVAYSTGGQIEVYDRKLKQTETIEDSDMGVWNLAVSGDANRIVYESDTGIFLYDQGATTLVTATADGEGENGSSLSPVISSDGTEIAYLTNSTNLGGWQPGSQGIHVALYDVASRQTKFYPTALTSVFGKLSISADGRYIGLAQSSGGGGWAKPYLIDTKSIDTKDQMQALTERLAEDDVKDKSYDTPAVSKDGRYALASLKDYNPSLSQKSDYIQLFDRATHTVSGIGNPAMNATVSAMDDLGSRLVFIEEDGLYTACTSDCQSGGSGDPIESVTWSAPADDKVYDEIRPESELTIQAKGQPGELINAEVTYMQRETNDAAPAAQRQTIALSESATVPGWYAGSFRLAPGVTQITSITAQLEGQAGSKSADSLPVNVAGTLAVDLDTAQTGYLNNSQLVITRSTPGMTAVRIPVSAANTHYTVDLPDASDYTVDLQNGDTVFASQEQVAIGNDRTTSIRLTPVFSAQLAVRIIGNDNPAIPTQVTFADPATGKALQTGWITGQGDIAWTGTHQAGNQVVAEVNPPWQYRVSAPIVFTLEPGQNLLNITLQKLDEPLTANVQFSKLVGPFGYAAIDSELDVTVHARPGLPIQGKLVYERWNAGDMLETAEATIDMPESRTVEGIYRGQFHIAPGMARLEEFQIKIGADWIAEKTVRLNRDVAGQVKAVFPFPNDRAQLLDLLRGAVFRFFDPNRYGYYDITSQQVDDADTYAFSVTSSARDSALSLIGQDRGSVLFSRNNIAFPGNGRTVEIQVTPQVKVAVNGSVKDKDGVSLSSRYVITDAADRVVTQGSSRGDFNAILPHAELNQTYHLKIEPADLAYESNQTDFVVDALAKSVSVVLERKPVAGLTGRVFAVDHTPAAGAVVTATLTGENGTSRTYRATAGASGIYSLELPAGTAKVEAVSSRSGQGLKSSPADVEIPATGSAEADLTLRDYGKVNFKLYTKQPGSDWQGPMDIDWRVAVHFGLRSSASILDYGPPFKVAAVAGDTVQICVNGQQGGLPQACGQAVLDDNNEAAIEIRLENAGAQISGRIENADGSPADHPLLQLYQLDEQGGAHFIRSIVPGDGVFTSPLSTAGRYRTVLQDRSDRSISAVAEFTVAAGQTLDLGELRLQAAGAFTGHLGTGSDSLTPDGRIAVHLDYAYAAKSGQADNARLILELPPGADPVPDTLVVNGRPSAASVHDGTLELPLGTVSVGASGKAEVQLSVADPGTDPDVVLGAKLLYTDAGREREQPLGTAVVQVVPVTLSVPATTTSLKLKASGAAPAGSAVRLYDGSLLLGQTTASPVGTWFMDVVLTDQGVPEHRLRAETSVGDRRLAGQEAVVRYDSDSPVLQQLSMRQTNGRTVTFDPSDGTAVFPYVIVPGYPFEFHLTFRKPERIDHVQVQLGDNIADARKQDDGTYSAYMPITANVGPIWVNYDVLPDLSPADMPAALPSEAQLRAQLPVAWQNFGIESVTPADAGASLDQGKTATIQADLSKALGKASIQLGVQRVQHYTPTADGAAQAARTGIPAYDVALSRSGNTITLSGYIPLSRLPKDNTAAAGLQMLAAAMNAGTNGKQASGRVRIAGLEDDVSMLKVTYNVLLEDPELIKGIWDGTTSLQNLNDILSDTTWAKLKRMKDRIDSLCDDPSRERLNSELNDIVLEAVMNTAIKVGMVLAGAAVGPETLGIGTLVLWGADYFLGQSLDAGLQDSINQLDKEIGPGEFHKCKQPPKPPQPPVGNPKYVWDPSGYVYEGLPDNRLEGVTATALAQDPDTGEWKVWDAAWYGESNPEQTDPSGLYGWDVPPGEWKVEFDKAGYETAFSDELPVPPPQLNVNVAMVTYAPPAVAQAMALPGGGEVEIDFDKPIDAASLQGITVAAKPTAGDGPTVTGSVYALNPEVGYHGLSLSKRIRFMPDEPLTAGQSYDLTIPHDIASYAGAPLEADVHRTVRVEAADTTAPAEMSGLSGGVTGQTATLVWQDPGDPDLAEVKVEWKPAADAAYTQTAVTIGKGVQWATIDGLDPSTAYTFRVSAVDASGNASSGADWSWTPGPAGTASPRPVTNLRVTSTEANQLWVVWTDPTAATGLGQLRVSWVEAGGQTTAAGTAYVAPGAEMYTIGGLKQGTMYTISVSAGDSAGNRSNPVILTATTAAASEIGDGSDTGGAGTDDGNVGPVPVDPAVQSWSWGSEGGFFTAFAGRLALDVKPDTVEPNTDVRASEMSSDHMPLSAGYAPVSNRYELKLNKEPQQPMTITIQYDPAGLGGQDPRRLSLYRRENGGTDWSYVGGVVDEQQKRIAASITEPGEYVVLLYTHPYADLAGHWGQDAIHVLVSRHVVQGVTDERFEPDRPITRAEMTALLVQAMSSSAGGLPATGKEAADQPASGEGGADEAGASAFADVPTSAWFAGDVAIAAQLGLVVGDHGRFRPDDAITREELAVMLERFFRLEADASAPGQTAAESADLNRFDDSGDISDWANAAIHDAVSRGWLQGVTDTALLPQGIATRAQSATMLLRVMTGLGQVTAGDSSRKETGRNPLLR